MSAPSHPAPAADVSWLRGRRGLALLLTAAVLRLASFFWGEWPSPFVHSFHPDEPKAYRTVQEFPHDYWHQPNFIYGTTLQNTLGALLLPVRTVLHALDRDPFFLQLAAWAARLLSVTAGVAGVWWCARFGTQLYGPLAGGLAAWLLAVVPVPAHNSAFATLDVASAAAFLLCVGALLRLAAAPSVRGWVLAGAAFGLLLGTKVNAAVALLLPVSLLVSTPELRARSLVPGLLLGAAAGLLVLFVGCPQYFTATRAWLDFLANERAEWILRPDLGPGDVLRLQFESVARCLTWPVLLLAAAGAVLGLVRGPRRWHVPLLLIVLGYAAILRPHLLSRFVVFISPILCWWAGLALAALASAARPLVRRAGWTLAAAAALTAASITVAGHVARWRDPRVAAARWLAGHVTPGQRVAGFTYWPDAAALYYYPSLPAGSESRWDAAPDYLIVASHLSARLAEALARHPDAVHAHWPADDLRFWPYRRAPAPAAFQLWTDLQSSAGPYQRIMDFPAPALGLDFEPDAITLYARR